MKDRSDVNRFNFGARASDTVSVFVHGGTSDNLEAWHLGRTTAAQGLLRTLTAH